MALFVYSNFKQESLTKQTMIFYNRSLYSVVSVVILLVKVND